RELLEQLWQRREAARPALEYAARRAAPAPVPQGWAPAPYGHAYVRGPGHGYGYPAAPYPSYNPYRM
ncbi:PrsW family intramembrane metalloprotease, partial [Streptomyces sp. SID6139]|nr:PrsW family intramembrane metalloprotease [Streptomyces sp. SID6139]